MDVRVIGEMFADWVVGDVLKLNEEVGGIAHVVFVVTRVPDFAGRLFASGERVAAFDELEAA